MFRQGVRGREMTIKHLLERKGRNVWTIDPDATVLDAVAKMAEKDIGSLNNRETLFPKCHSQRQNVPQDVCQGHHGEKRNTCPGRTIGRVMHGPDDR